MVTKPAACSYEFGSFRLDVAKRLLLRNGEIVALTPKCFDILLVLVESGGALLSKDELMRRVWPDSFVEENNLTYNISVLRKALGEQAGNHQYIVTVSGRGYRFVVEVREISEKPDESAPVEPAPPLPVQRKTKSIVAVAAGALVVFSSILIYWVAHKPTATSKSPASIKSIAVLPFKPLQGESDDEHLGLGMADTLITKLSGGVQQLIVRPTSAVLKYADKAHDPISIGREQKVDAVLEGSLQKAGDKVRVTVRLLNVADGSSLWSYKCDGICTDLFATQDAISEQVATALMLKLTGEEKSRLSKRYTENAEAYQNYVKGRYFWNKRTAEGFNKALDFFNQAIIKDPRYALAYAGLSDTYALIGGYGFVPQHETIPKAKEAARKALELDASLAEVHLSLGTIAWNYDWNFGEAEKEFRQALALNPHYSTAHHYLGEFLVLQGRFDEGLAEIERARELDPASLIINADIGKCLYMARRYDEAIAQSRRTLEMEPNFMRAYPWLLGAYREKREFDEELAVVQKWVETGKHVSYLSPLADLYAASGKSAEARKVLEKMEQAAKRTYINPVAMAIPHAQLRDNDRALEWLEKEYETRGTGLTALKVDPSWDHLRADPRFQDLLRRVGFTQ